MLRKASALLLAGLCVARSAAADAPAGAADLASAREAASARAAEVTKLLAGLESDRSEAGALKRRRLERLGRELARHLDDFRRADELAAQRVELEALLRRDVAKTVPGKPPFRVVDYDAAETSVADAQQSLADLEAAAKDASDSLEEARVRFEKRHGAGAAAGGEGGESGEQAAAPEPDAEKQAGAALLLEIAERNLEHRRQKLANAREAAALAQLDVAARERALDWVAERVVASDVELERELAAIDAEDVALENRRGRAELELGAAKRRWESLARRSVSEAESGAEAAALRAELGARQKEVALLGERLDHLDRAREALRRRFAVLSGRATRAEIRGWLGESRDAGASIERELRLSRAELEGVNQEVASLEAEAPAPAEAMWRGRQLQALRGSIAALQESIESQTAELQREQRLALATERVLGQRDWLARLRDYWERAEDVWSYEVMRTEDRSITVGRIASAILTFLLGAFAARLLTVWIGASVLPRLGFDEGAASAYQSLVYYVLLGFAFFVAMRTVDIPLAAFAVLGGALAIGVGFGSQNIVNNFISGLILLAERPIKKGDLVQVDATHGNVERIGLRSTRIRTSENIHVIVPNSAFLEGNVTNWTHHDPDVRIKIAVSVPHGTSTREVEKLLRQALAANAQVMASPEPIVLLKEFADATLQFEVHFWVRIHAMMDRYRTESEVRFRIDDLFRDAGIAIGSKLREVRPDGAAPIPIRPAERGPAGGAR